MDIDEKILKLRKPVSIGEGDNAITYAELKLREPVALELEKAERASTSMNGQAIMLISLISGLPKAAIEKLCQRDLKAAADFLGSFNEDDPATGETSSLS